MHKIFAITCFGGFLLLPFLVLVLRATRPRLMPWWFVFTIIILFGWLFVLAPSVLSDELEGGGARAFALLFGWAYALIWSIPPLLIYGFSQLCWRFSKKRAHRLDR